MSRYPMDFATLYGMYQQRQATTQPNFLTQAFANQFGMGNYNNEARYGDILSGRTDIYNRNMDRINSLGAQERENINRRADEQLAAQRSSLVSRGLGGTTVREAIENRSLEDRNRALREQSDNEVRQRIATDSALADNVYATMERRNDVVPDLGQLAQLNQAVGASGMYGQYPGMGGVAGAPRTMEYLGEQRPGMTKVGGRWMPNRDPSRSIGTMGQVGNMGPGVGGAGGPPTAGGYPLPGGGTSTPTYMPQPMPGHMGPGSGGAGGGYGGPQGGFISKYRGGDRVGSAIESQLLNRLKGYSGVSQPINMPMGMQAPQQGPRLRTAGDIDRSPQQQINDYMTKRLRDNVYGINPNPTFKGMGGPPTFTIGGMPQYLEQNVPIYNYEYSGPMGGGYTRGRTGARGGMGGVPLSGAVRSGGKKKDDVARKFEGSRKERIAQMAAMANAKRHSETQAMAYDPSADIGNIDFSQAGPGFPSPESLGIYDSYQPSVGMTPERPAATMPSVPNNPLYEPNPGRRYLGGGLYEVTYGENTPLEPFESFGGYDPRHSTAAWEYNYNASRPKMNPRDRFIARQNFEKWLQHQREMDGNEYHWFGNTADALSNVFMNTMDALDFRFGTGPRPYGSRPPRVR